MGCEYLLRQLTLCKQRECDTDSISHAYNVSVGDAEGILLWGNRRTERIKTPLIVKTIRNVDADGKDEG